MQQDVMTQAQDYENLQKFIALVKRHTGRTANRALIFIG